MENNLKKEFNPERIDWWIEMGGTEVTKRSFQYIEGAKLEIKESELPVSITITIKKENHNSGNGIK